MTKKAVLLYTFLFMGLWGIWLIPFVIRGNGLVGLSDSFNQYYPVFAYIGQYVRSSLATITAGLPQFDFRIGLGDDILTTLNYYGFGDIPSLLSALAPLRYAEGAFIAVTLLRYYLCGLAFMVYAKKYVAHPFLIIAGALMYGGSIFGLLFGMRFSLFLTPMFTLPLILRGIDDLLHESRRRSGWLISALFIQALTGFYFLYMEIIIAVIYSLIKIITLKKPLRRFVLSLTVQGLLGLGLGSVILLPAVMGVFRSNRLNSPVLFNSLGDLFIYNDRQFYLSKLIHLLTPEAYEASVTIPIAMLAGMICLYSGYKKHKEFKWLLGIMVLLFLLPVMGSVMNGFSIATDRWYFIILLIGITATIQTMQEETWFSRKKTAAFWISGSLLIFINLLASGLNWGTVIRTAAFLFFIFTLPFVWNRKKMREKWLLTYVTGTVLISGLFLFGPRALGGSGFSAEFKAYGQAQAQIEESAAGLMSNPAATANEITVQNLPFERWDIYASSRGAALAANYFGTTEYFSIINAQVIEFYRNLAISPGNPGKSFDTLGLDSRIELEALLSVSQYMDFVTQEAQPVPVIRPNNLFLPLGFTYDNWISREAFDRLTPPEKLTMIAERAVLEEDITAFLPPSAPPNLTNPPPPDYPDRANTPVKIDIEYINIEKDLQYLYTNNDSKIRIWLDPPASERLAAHNDELYVKLDDFALHSAEWRDFTVGNKTLQLRNELLNFNQYDVIPDEYWVNITELQHLNGKYYFDIYSLGENCYSLVNIEVIYHPINWPALNKRRQNSLNALTLENNRISGHIITDQPELLFISVPYSPGWSATVNGEKSEIYQTNIAFMSLLLPAGEHEISFTYRTPGLIWGAFISIFSLFCLLFYLRVIKHLSILKRYSIFMM